MPFCGRLARMETTEFVLSEDYVPLNQLLKLTGIADSGGTGKQIVAAGEVKVDGQPESRKTAKIRAGRVVLCRGVSIHVRAP